MGLRVGISSSFITEVSLRGVQTIIESVKTNRGEVPFMLSTRERGEDSVTDNILAQLENKGVPLICVSSARHRSTGEKDWRDKWGKEVLEKVAQYPTDFVFLFGDMTIWPPQMCEKLRGLNLHPDLPGRFKGEWWKVLAQVVESKAEEAGAMIHLVTSGLDEGPPVAYCQFSLRGSLFDKWWDSLPKDADKLQQLIKEQKELKRNPTHPLWQEIRREGLKRELPLLQKTIELFAEGKIKIEGQGIFNELDQELKGGYDLTEKIEEMVRPILESQSPTRKEEGK